MKYLFKQTAFQDKIKPYYLSGFGSSRSSGEHLGIATLGASVLWLQDDLTDIVFISIDTLYVPEKVASPIYDYFQKTFGIAKSQIIFNATHTHSAYGIEEKLDKELVDLEHIQTVIDAIIMMLTGDLAFVDCTLQYAEACLPEKVSISRRKYGLDIKRFFLAQRMLRLPNDNNRIDDTLRVITVYDLTGKLQLIVYELSCHPVFNTGDVISSDYIGCIAEIITNKLNVNSIFLQGFLGDIRPNFTTADISAVKLTDKLKIIFNGTVFRGLNSKDLDYFCATVCRCLETVVAGNTGPMIALNEPIRVFHRSFVLKSATGRTERAVTVKMVLLLPVLFVSIPAEVNSRYILDLAEGFPALKIVPLGMGDDIVGYLPFYSEVVEGGYEVESLTNYGWDSCFADVSLQEFYHDLVSFITVSTGASYVKH